VPLPTAAIAYFTYGGSVATTSKKINVRPAIKMFKAISLESSDERTLNQRDHAVEKCFTGLDVMRILM
jgi:hypothetical protein